MTVTVVSHHVVHYLPDLLLQLLHKLSRIITFVFDVTQLLLPYSCQLTTLQQFLLDGIDEFYACGSSHEVLPFAPDIMTFKQRLYDAGSRRWATDAVLLQRRPQFLVLDKLSRRFHGSQQGCLGVVFRWCGPFLCQCGLMVSALPFHEGGQRALLISLVLLVVRLYLYSSILSIHLTPS